LGKFLWLVESKIAPSIAWGLLACSSLNLWSYCSKSEAAMERYIAWIRSLPGKPMFAAHPLLFDGVWMDNYLRTYVNLQLFSGPLPVEELFVGAGIDVASYAHAALNLRFTERRPDYPPSVLGNTEHTHHPLEDAREHAAIFFNCREIIRKK